VAVAPHLFQEVIAMKITVSVCITEQQYAALVAAADSTGLAKSDIIRRALDKYLLEANSK
jgi:hypothetical protein